MALRVHAAQTKTRLCVCLRASTRRFRRVSIGSDELNHGHFGATAGKGAWALGMTSEPAASSPRTASIMNERAV